MGVDRVPPGYVGSDKPGRLTGEIYNNPDAVLLLDEIEKANQKIWDPFLRVLDEGKLKDQSSKGFTADFKNVMIFLTSNLLQTEDFIEDEKELRNKVLSEGYFRPELLNRINRIVMFKRFDVETIRDISADIVHNFVENFAKNNKLENVDIQLSRSVVDYIIKNIDLKFGVRDAQRFIEKNLGDVLADAYLDAKTKGSEVSEIVVKSDGKKMEVSINEIPT